MTVAEKVLALQPAKSAAGCGEWVQAVDALMAEVAEWSHSLAQPEPRNKFRGVLNTAF